MIRKRTTTVAGVRLQRTSYLGDLGWSTPLTHSGVRILFYRDVDINVPAPKGSRIRSGAVYAPRWRCRVDDKAYPYIGAWFDTITEIIERLTREGHF